MERAIKRGGREVCIFQILLMEPYNKVDLVRLAVFPVWFTQGEQKIPTTSSE